MSERAKLGVLCVLLLLALGFAVVKAANTFQAARNLQMQYRGARVGDVSTIRPWMTIHAISHFYHVPEDYLHRSLEISTTDSLHRATLYEIAAGKRQPVDQVIRILQHAILAYHKEHPNIKTPTPGRTKY